MVVDGNKSKLWVIVGGEMGPPTSVQGGAIPLARKGYKSWLYRLMSTLGIRFKKQNGVELRLAQNVFMIPL